MADVKLGEPFGLETAAVEKIDWHYDLVLNEAKSVIMPKSALMTEEPDLEALFEEAVAEIADQIDEDDFDADYGFQSEWEDEEVDQQDLELRATISLFDSISSYPGHEENIERFCLPLFAKAGSDHALAHAMDAFKKRPSMSQIYTAYLVKFLDVEGVKAFLIELLRDASQADWQNMWVLAALLQLPKADEDAVKVALAILRDTSRDDTLRAVAAIYVGRFGDHARRKALATIYPTGSSYIQAAIYYSSRRWPGVERSNAKAKWGGHGLLNGLLTTAFAKK